jgi:hypothetical protein
MTTATIEKQPPAAAQTQPVSFPPQARPRPPKPTPSSSASTSAPTSPASSPGPRARRHHRQQGGPLRGRLREGRDRRRDHHGQRPRSFTARRRCSRCSMSTLSPRSARASFPHTDAARDFMQHIRQLADPSGKADIRAVVGVPANAGEQAREEHPPTPPGDLLAHPPDPRALPRRARDIGTTRGSSSRATSTRSSIRSSSTSAAARATSASSRAISRRATTRSASLLPGDAIDEILFEELKPHLPEQRPLADHRA